MAYYHNSYNSIIRLIMKVIRFKFLKFCFLLFLTIQSMAYLGMALSYVIFNFLTKLSKIIDVKHVFQTVHNMGLMINYLL